MQNLLQSTEKRGNAMNHTFHLDKKVKELYTQVSYPFCRNATDYLPWPEQLRTLVPMLPVPYLCILRSLQKACHSAILMRIFSIAPHIYVCDFHALGYHTTIMFCNRFHFLSVSFVCDKLGEFGTMDTYVYYQNQWKYSKEDPGNWARVLMKGEQNVVDNWTKAYATDNKDKFPIHRHMFGKPQYPKRPIPEPKQYLGDIKHGPRLPLPHRKEEGHTLARLLAEEKKFKETVYDIYNNNGMTKEEAIKKALKIWKAH